MVLALLPTGFSAAGAVYFATGHEMRTPLEAAGFTGLCLAFVILGIYTAVSTHCSKILLEANAISISGVFRTRSIRKLDVNGRRIRPGYNGAPATLVLVPARPGVKSLTYQSVIKTTFLLYKTASGAIAAG